MRQEGAATLLLIKRRFGPKHTETELRRMNFGAGFNGHDGCWVNDWDCGDPDCPMGPHDGQPEKLARIGLSFSVEASRHS
jgi:hypothetical protein